MRNVLLSVFAAFVGLQAAGEPLSTISALNEAIFSDQTNCQKFVIRGTLINLAHDDSTLSVFDGTNAALLAISRAVTNLDFKTGDYLELSGHTSPRYASPAGSAVLINVRFLGRRPVPAPLTVSASDIHSGRFRNRLVRFSGTVRDVAEDEIDPNYVFIELRADGESVFTPIQADQTVRSQANALVGARVDLIGLCHPRSNGQRRHMGNMIALPDGLSSVRVVKPPPDNPFDAPDIRALDRLRPAEISRRDWHSAEGHVLCAWNGCQALLHTPDDRIVRVNFDKDGPNVGSYVAVCGFPEANLYHVNLFRARWKSLPARPFRAQMTTNVTAVQLLEDGKGHAQIHPEFHGRAVKIVGTVSSLETDRRQGSGILLECDNRPIPIIFGDGAALTPPESGARVEVTGVCFVESEPWRPSQRFPRITGLAVVTRTPSDLVVLAAPPWWTPRRFLFTLGLMGLAMAGLFVWNRSLQVLATRRGHQLFREEVAHCEARFRVDERTRLAVELHDSLAQNLTGVSLKIDAALRMADSSPDRMLEYLGIASKALKSCRAELRNSLWDLRHQTLEVDDMEDAIRQTLEPHVAGIALIIRFKVPRKRISDNTAHAILCIVRELTVNAVRHGQATSVRIAGSTEADKLLFSVRDNGCGFDPDTCPNDEQGHYGLLGIRERVNAFEGTLAVASRLGEGTKVSVTLNIPQTT